ncbi:MAG: hypothetical protein HY901_35305 [Deltaproteobacteria bacterium]|nr:hypothetical protein [Deltaproteobacteria bacterium]
MAADDRLSRFKNLEKVRREEAGAQPAVSARFGALERAPEGAPAPPSSPVSVERFAPPSSAASQPALRTLEDVRRAAAAPSGLELATFGQGEQPFVRCARCKNDHHALASVCSHCEANLHTPEQQDFNERLWGAMRAEEEKAREAASRAQAALMPTGPSSAPLPFPSEGSTGLTPEQQRALAEQMAREVAEHTRARIEGDSLIAGLGRGDSLGVFAWGLSRIPPRVRATLWGVGLGVPVLLLLFKGTRPLGLGCLALGALLALRAWMGR